MSNTSPVLENGTPTLHSTSRSLIRTTDKIVAGAIQGAVRCFSVLLNRQNSVRRGRNPREKTKIDQALRSGSFEFDFCQKSPGSSIPQKNSIPASHYYECHLSLLWFRTYIYYSFEAGKGGVARTLSGNFRPVRLCKKEVQRN